MLVELKTEFYQWAKLTWNHNTKSSFWQLGSLLKALLNATFTLGTLYVRHTGEKPATSNKLFDTAFLSCLPKNIQSNLTPHKTVVYISDEGCEAMLNWMLWLKYQKPLEWILQVHKHKDTYTNKHTHRHHTTHKFTSNMYTAAWCTAYQAWHKILVLWR